MTILLSRLLLPFLIAFPIIAAADVPSLRVDVEVEGKSSYKNVRGSSTRTKTQSRTLEIEVSTLAKEAVPGTKIKWTIFGRSLKNRDLVQLKSGERTVKVPAFGKAELSSKEVKVTGTREHVVTTQQRGRGRRPRINSRKVAASGQSYYGYAVEVYFEGKLVTAKYSHPSLEKELHPGKR